MRRPTTLLAASCAALLAAACLGSTPPSRFYVLEPLAEAPARAGAEVAASPGAASPGSGGPAVRVAAVHLPRYLRGNEIVTRPAPGRLELADLDRWGGSLEDDFARALATNLARLLPDTTVARHGWARDEPFDATLMVDVSRFDAAAGTVILRAHWTLTGPGSATLATRTTEHVRPVEGEGYPAVVAAMSAALADLSAAIADAARAAGILGAR